jgi:hypothetical protein
MIICTTAKSVYYPVSRQRAEVIRGSARVRYVRGSLLVNAKSFDKSIKGVNGRGPVYAAYSFIRVKDNSEDFDVMDDAFGDIWHTCVADRFGSCR